MSGWFDLVAGLAGAGLNAWGASQAADAQQQGLAQSAQTANNALQLQQGIYNQNRADLAPWRMYGGAGLQRYADTLGPSFQESPGYQFALQQGGRALDRSAASRGMLDSGAQRMAQIRFGQGLQNQEYGRYQNQLAALAGLGQTAVGQGIQAGGQFGGQVGQSANLLSQIQAGQGQAAGAGYLGMANAVGGGLNNLANYWRGGGY